ncbi:MAG TPA: DUF2459 domain-containing protein [Tepidisphaeraceae bacterium]|nr:DUF2459 domain-containing protein [Tepidisphaeraceae bacterium]
MTSAVPRRAIPIIIMLTLLATIHAGCATTVVTPPPAPGSVAVFLTDYGRHSSILLPNDAGVLTEFAFGDYQWFALGETSMGKAVRAMLFSSGSTLGRRTLAPTGEAEQVARATGAAHVARFEAPRERVDALRSQLDARFEERIDTVTYNPLSQLWFVRDEESYGLLHNCNHVTARWLRALGCEIRGTAMFSNFKVTSRAAKLPRPRRQTTRPVAAATGLPPFRFPGLPPARAARSARSAGAVSAGVISTRPARPARAAAAG